MERYRYQTSNEPHVFRETKWLLDIIAYWTLGKWLDALQTYFPPFRLLVRQVPNAMSIFRIPVSPLVAWMLMSSIAAGDTQAAWRWLGATAALIILDGLDGPLARQLNAVSDFGKAIDPAADKVLALTMALSFLVLTWRFEGVAVALLLAFILGWSFRIELQLINIARHTKIAIDRHPGIELPGANMWGKIKFSIQSVSLLAAYAALILSPIGSIGPILLIAAWSVARWFADMSLGQHRKDLWSIENGPHLRAIHRDGQTKPGSAA